MFEEMMAQYERVKADLSGMWAAIDVTMVAAKVSDSLKKSAGTPENANMVDKIEKSRTGGSPVTLQAFTAPVPEEAQSFTPSVQEEEVGVFTDTTADTTVSDLGNEEELMSLLDEEDEFLNNEGYKGDVLDMELFKSQLVEDEGLRNKVYEDTEGNLTVGVGHKVLPEDNLKRDSVLDSDAVERIFDKDAISAVKQASTLAVNWESLPAQAKHVLANMTFQLGKAGVSKFEKTLDLINKKDFKGASVEMLDSKWAKQTPNRAKKMSALMASIT
jgi:lysozyme|tara:strand:- start:46 stop:864 length:819 start_codon:yes stop_codon:yes gene_type:complete